MNDNRFESFSLGEVSRSPLLDSRSSLGEPRAKQKKKLEPRFNSKTKLTTWVGLALGKMGEGRTRWRSTSISDR
jgi:hypothetical protein